jgi:transcriptional regulator with XRE-family HTH domain
VSRRVPAGPITAHVNARIAEGMSCKRIAAIAGVSRSAVAAIAAGRHATVQAAVADGLLAVTGPRITGPHDLMPAHGTIRRIRALMAVGHATPTIARHTGLTETTIRTLADGTQPAVQAATHRAVRAAYNRLAPRPGVSVHTRRTAAQRHWAPPQAWGGGIDARSARPAGDPAYTAADRNRTRTETADLVDAAPARAQLRALAARGYPLNYVAAEAGVSSGALSLIRSGTRARIQSDTADAIARTHRRLAGTAPADCGIHGWGVGAALLTAGRHGWTADPASGRAAA